MKSFAILARKTILFLAFLISFSSVFSIVDGSVKKGPYLIYEDTNTEMKVVWQNSITSTDIIRWGTNTSYLSGSADSYEYGTDHQHAYVINGLIPGTKYYYQVESTGSLYNGSFYTAMDASSTSLKFIAYGDTRSFPEDHNLVAQEIISTYTSEPEYQTVLISMGDLVNDGDLETDWSDQFFETELPYINSMLANIPYQSTMGNHEGSGVLFQKYFPYNFQADRYYSFEYGPALFLILDQYVSYLPGSDQYIWLENELANTDKAWKIIYYHEPGWTADGGHENNTDVQNYIQPLCEEYGVHITFAGHNHLYSRAEVNLNNTIVQHITTGGGGAPLVDPDPTYPFIVATAKSHHFCKVNIIDENLMDVVVIDTTGSIIDQFSIDQTFNAYPSVSITDPLNNTHYESTQQITISADAVDSNGTIAELEFFVDGNSVGTDNIAPYSVNWTIPVNGVYSLTAKATDDQGAYKISSPISITVGQFTGLASSQIISGNDDVEEAIDDGEMYISSTDIELVYDEYNETGNQIVGLRFTTLGIPQGAIINNAYIQYTVDETSTSDVDLTITGEKSDNSSGFTTSAYNVSDRNITTASVNWIPPAWNSVGESGTDQQTPDLSSIIQEIVDLPAFSPSSAISLFFTGTGTGKRIAEAYEGEAGSSAILNIDYLFGGLNNSPEFLSDPVVEIDATEDSPYSGSIADNASDPDGDDLTFSKSTGPAWLTIASDGSLSGTPLNDDVGLNSWEVNLDDGFGGIAQSTLEITVINLNDFPVFVSDPIIKSDAAINVLYEGTLLGDVLDIDGDALLFTVLDGPAWLTIATDGSFSGIPLSGDIGQQIWSLQVDDGHGGIAIGNLQVVVMDPSIVSYCESYGNAIEEWIASVTIGTYDNSSGSSGTIGYEDFTGSAVFNVESGATYDLLLEPGFLDRGKFQYWGIWVDFNVDGDFDDAGEKLYSSYKNKSVVSGTITIPDISSIETRMRVSMKRSVAPTSCEVYDYGEVEDYTIAIIGSTPPPPVAPIADFTSDITSVTVNGMVQFSDLSSNEPTSWSWTFPGGSPASSIEQNPSVTYATAGLFDVTLEATNDEGSHSITALGYIIVSEPLPPAAPVANFTSDITSVTVNGMVQFSDDSSNEPTSWLWSFEGGDPSTSTAQNPSVSYATAGSFDVSLIATNTGGSDTKTVIGYISVSEPSTEYCASSGLSTSIEWIESVSIDGVVFQSGNNGGYLDINSISLTPGSTVPVILTPGFSGKSDREFWRIWIDFNNDSDFEDADEEVFVVNNTKAIETGSISIPFTETITTKMRISMKMGSAPSPCEIFARGEVEDFTVSFSDGLKSMRVNTNDEVLNDKISEPTFKVYPNPGSDKLFLEFNDWEGATLVKLYNMTGKIVYTESIADSKVEIDISSFPKGIYLLNVANGIFIECEKIIIQ